MDEPMGPQLTRQTKQMITLEKHFLSDYYGRDNTAQDIEGPANAITCQNSKHLVSVKGQFMSQAYGSYHKDGRIQSHATNLDDPLNTVTTVNRNSLVTCQMDIEKSQFISNFFNSSGNPGTNNKSLDDPLNSIMTNNKSAIITAIKNGNFDFDIKMRFLTPEELSRISTFPPKYFTDPRLKLTIKEQTKLIGNAVPPEWARLIIQPVVEELQSILTAKKIAV
jgi:DNA (cytosine-5)-methyltransferase 1